MEKLSKHALQLLIHLQEHVMVLVQLAFKL
jgi:hypothetical protein